MSFTESADIDRSFLDDPEWRASTWGVGGAIALLLGGLIVGLVEGNLLPGECEGLACLFTGIVLGYAGVVLAVWIVVGVSLAIARQRWPTSAWRLWVLRVLAALSWAPFVGLVVIAFDI